MVNKLQKLVTPLLDWYARNARVLPWRSEPTPYRVWISEIMLQQTRVEAVKDYFVRFLDRLPDVRSLSTVPDDELMKLWEGLGYYSRAGNLKKAAQMIVSRHQGVFPSGFDEILNLPGIGEYTAGAVSSIAFNQPTPAVDGNVLRVLSRYTGSRADISEMRTKQRFTEMLRKIYPSGKCGDFTQSLMELGALVCIPNGAPKCTQCPLQNDCTAFLEHTVDVLPIKSPAKGRITEYMWLLLLRCGEKIAIRKRPKHGMLANLWEFPNFSNPEQMHDFLRDNAIPAATLKEMLSAKHIFTHKEWQMTAFRAECPNELSMFQWVDAQTLTDEIPLPSAFKPFLKKAFADID